LFGVLKKHSTAKLLRDQFARANLSKKYKMIIASSNPSYYSI
jgi:hypothetical protein